MWFLIKVNLMRIFKYVEISTQYFEGTLDALMPNNNEETINRIKQYFMEINRITKFGGRYICISLLQEHILKILLDYFVTNNWMFRAIRCLEVEQAAVDNGEKLTPVFIVVCTKFKLLPRQVRCFFSRYRLILSYNFFF